MSPSARILLLLTALLPAAALAALPGPSAQEVETNRRQLAELRKTDPDAYHRLLASARAFLALPESERQRLQQLDAQLGQLPASGQAQLLRAARRYADWLIGLPEADRKAIQEAPDSKERLRRIRAIRERQWRASLPKTVREQLHKLKGKELAERITALREEEEQHRRDWKIVAHFWDELVKGKRLRGAPAPLRLDDLLPADKVYVEQVLRPRLSSEEWDRLTKSQGQWPRFPRLLVELTDAHPPALLGPRGPTQVKELPREFTMQLTKYLKQQPKQGRWADWFRMKAKEGHWPEFALAVVELAHEAKLHLPRDYWPAGRDELSDAVHRFLKNNLEPVLDSEEKASLKKAEGHWPAFPETLQRLASRHSLTVPWQTLFGPRSRWDKYRPSGR
jgi:hypothetical protein